jgi:outer membrane protein assembly factor BamB
MKRRKKANEDRPLGRQWLQLIYGPALIMLLVATSYAAQDWNQWGGDRAFNAPMRLSTIDTTMLPQLAWSASMEPGNSGIAVRGRSIVTLGRQGAREFVRGFDLITGVTLWSFSYQAELPDFFDAEFGKGPHATPVLGDTMGVSIGASGIVHGFDLKSGQILWTRSLWTEFPATRSERGFASSPLMVGDLVVVALGGRGCGLLALDARTGSTVWAAHDFESSYASPIIAEFDGQQQVVALMKQNLIGVDPLKGTLLWSRDFVSPNSVHVASPVLTSDGRVFVGSNETSLLGQPMRSAGRWQFRTDWTSPRMRPQLGNVIEVAGLLVGPTSGSPGKFTTGLALKTGVVEMTRRIGGRGFYYRCVDGFISLNERGDLTFVSFIDGKPEGVETHFDWISRPAWSAAALGSKWIVVRNRDRIQRYDLKLK